MLWNNVDVNANTPIYVDVFNIQQPMSSNTSPNIITISVDTDGDYFNGVTQDKEITDSAPSSAAIADLIITHTSISTNYIRSPQTIII